MATAVDHRSSTTDSPIEEALEIEPTNLTSIEPVPPNGGYGWVCTLSVFLINAHTWGINSSWAVIMAHLSLPTSPIQASHLQYSLVGGLSISQALLVSPLVSPLSHIIGTRSTLLAGTLLMAAALLAASFASHAWHLFLSQGVCFGWGMGLTYIAASAALPPWFSTRRSLAVGLSTSGAGIGGLVYSLVANSAIQHVGVSWAYRILSLSSLAANTVASLLLKDTGSRTQQATTSKAKPTSFTLRDFTRFEVLMLMFWGVATDLGYITLLYSIPSYAASIGLTPAQGSLANALLNLGLGIGRPFVGYVSDSLGRINMALAMTCLCAILCFGLWIPARTFASLAAFSLLAGPLCGTFWATITPVLVEVVGLQRLAGTFGVICLSLVLPTTFAESAAMQLVVSDPDGDAGEGSYVKTQVFVGCMFLAGTASLWLLRAWKIFATESEMGSHEGVGARRSRVRVSWLTPGLLFRFWHV